MIHANRAITITPSTVSAEGGSGSAGCSSSKTALLKVTAALSVSFLLCISPDCSCSSPFTFFMQLLLSGGNSIVIMQADDKR